MSTPEISNPRKSRRRLGPWRARLVLLLFSVLVSVIVLLIAEGATRLAGFGGYGTTFDEVGVLDDGSTLVMTQHAGPASYFFATRSRAGSLDVAAFAMPKPADTVRVVVAGGSAAKGSPWTRHLAASSFLEEMLSDCWPQKRVEVVNIGTTAIASYPVLGMVTEALEYDPDFVVAYLGNNEFYGAYGVASLHSVGRSPRMIRSIRAIRSLGIAQFFDAQRQGYDTSDRRSLMEAMVGRASISPEDPARSAAAQNLETFVGDLIDRCAERGVPVIVCPPPCNESGLAPLGARADSELTPAQQERLSGFLDSAQTSLEVDDASLALASLESAIAIDADHALAHYLRARALEELGREDVAAASYRLAVDLDPMPWRPPSMSVDAVRRAAESRGAVLCDLPEIFRSESAGGTVGWELMADHVHPSLRGQALIARSIVRAMDGFPERIRVESEVAARLPDWEVYAERLGASEYDEYAAASAMRTLGRIPFFLTSNPHYLERFDARCREIEAASPTYVVSQLQAWQDPSTHKGGWRPLTGLVGLAIFAQGDYARAGEMFDAARRSVTPYGSWELQYTAFWLRCRGAIQGELSDAEREIARESIERGQFLIRNGWSGTGAGERYTGEMLAMLGEHGRAIELFLAGRAKQTDEGKVAIDGNLVGSYIALGRFDDAREVVDAGIGVGDRFRQYYLGMADRIRVAGGG
ncbi:MAG: tetratricopeptide repeat protein [Planctomycetota bacterium]|jgi:tetratricopeptide (TPR) repeat protein